MPGRGHPVIASLASGSAEQDDWLDRRGTNVPAARDRQPCRYLQAARNLRDMAQRNDRVLRTTRLARMDGENATYTRASDNLP
jgi:hypothetical protein